MSSFLFAFRGLLAALAAIVVVETTVAVVVPSKFIERTSYMSWMFGRDDAFHKLLIFEKLSELPLAKANIVQVGDSSGFYGIRPDIVMRRLGGLRYVNLSCCANTGFDGYYDLAKFALERMERPAAIVLYLNFNNLPRPDIVAGDRDMGATSIHDAIAGPWSFIALPSLALRSSATDIAYTFDGLLSARRLTPSNSREYNEMMVSILRTDGWWAEQDRRPVRTNRAAFYERNCGDDDLAETQFPFALANEQLAIPPKYASLSLDVFRRFAQMADQHHVKLIIIFHPHPCKTYASAIIGDLRHSLAIVKSEHPSVSVYPRQLFEHWPRDTFILWNHVRVGFEGLNSVRASRFIADALGVAPEPSDSLTEDELPPKPIDLDSKPIWSGTPIGEGWRFSGTSAASEAGAARVSESGGMERHYFHTAIRDLVPQQDYVVSMLYKSVGPRKIYLSLTEPDGRSEGQTDCDSGTGEAARRGSFYDGELFVAADGWLVCWGSVRVKTPTAVIGVDILPQDSRVLPYQGDGTSGVIVKRIALHRGLRPTIFGDQLSLPAMAHSETLLQTGVQ